MNSIGHPANTRRWINVVLMLGHRLRRWPDFEPALVQRLGRYITQYTRDVKTMLVKCGARVVDDEPPLKRHWFDVSCLLGTFSSQYIVRYNKGHSLLQGDSALSLHCLYLTSTRLVCGYTSIYYNNSSIPIVFQFRL